MESSPSASRRGAGEQAAPVWRAALYTRLSREDGDKPESDSISNQRALLEDFLSRRPDLCPAGWYADGSSIVGLSQKELAKQVFSDLVQLFSHFTTL